MACWMLSGDGGRLAVLGVFQKGQVHMKSGSFPDLAVNPYILSMYLIFIFEGEPQHDS
jgi:hypothetical protein